MAQNTVTWTQKSGRTEAITRPDGTYYRVTATVDGGNVEAQASSIPVEPFKTVQFDFSARGYGLGSGGLVNANLFDANGGYVANKNLTSVVPFGVGDNFATYSYKLDVPSGVYSVVLSSAHYNAVIGDYVDLDPVVTTTDVTPAPEPEPEPGTASADCSVRVGGAWVDMVTHYWLPSGKWSGTADVTPPPVTVDAARVVQSKGNAVIGTALTVALDAPVMASDRLIRAHVTTDKDSGGFVHTDAVAAGWVLEAETGYAASVSMATYSKVSTVGETPSFPARWTTSRGATVYVWETNLSAPVRLAATTVVTGASNSLGHTMSALSADSAYVDAVHGIDTWDGKWTTNNSAGPTWTGATKVADVKDFDYGVAGGASGLSLAMVSAASGATPSLSVSWQNADEAYLAVTAWSGVPSEEIEVAPDPSSTEYLDAVMADSPQAFWRLDETSGTTLTDQVNNAPLTLVGPTLDQSPLIVTGRSASFDGVDDYASGNGLVVGGGTNVSVEAWVRINSLGKQHTILANCKDDSNDGVFLAVDTNNRPTMLVGVSSSNKGIVVGAALSTNTVYHLVGTYDGTTMRIYVNGVEVGSTAYAGGISWWGDRSLRMGGQVKTFNQSSRFLNGTADEVAIYSTALSAGRVLAHYEAGA